MVNSHYSVEDEIYKEVERRIEMQREGVGYTSREGKVDYVCVCTCLCLYCISSECYVRYNYKL